MIGCSPGFLARAVEAAEGVPLTALPDRLGRVALRSGDERNNFGSVTFVIVFFKWTISGLFFFSFVFSMQ